ncbi:MAG: hypothetical protein KBD06_01015 [Candidatus Pacebacteria bacterium]|nr:hypothetical protein [Candidatus Paceibacterota bacterium]
MEIFLAKLFGLYFLIIGVIVLVRRKAVMPAVAELAGNRPVLLTLAIIEIGAGLALALAYPTITWSIEGIFSVIGYMLLVEGLIYLASPYRTTQKFLRSFNKSEWFMTGAVASVLVGGYMVAYGFNLL